MKDIQQQLTPEQQFFLTVLRDFLHNQKTTASTVPDVNWDDVKRYAVRHQVTAIFYYQTDQKIFEGGYARQIYRNSEFQRTVVSFRESMKSFQYILPKGLTVADLYAVPALRSMGDVDVLIHEKDREAVHNALVVSGFCFQKEAEGEWKYTKNNCLFEVHDSLVHRRDELKELVEYFSHVWDYVDGNQLDWSYHLIYLIEHLRHHFVQKGVGFRQFMDVAIVSEKCDINWTFVTRELKKIQLYDFALNVFAFIKEWFDITVPLNLPELSENFFIKATRKILDDGVFGANNQENQRTDLSVQMIYKTTDYKRAKRQYLWKRFFPDYVYMCRLPFCAYVKKSKLLLPIAWLHRIFYRAFSKKSRDDMKQQLSEDSVNARMEMLHQWGL